MGWGWGKPCGAWASPKGVLKIQAGEALAERGDVQPDLQALRLASGARRRLATHATPVSTFLELIDDLLEPAYEDPSEQDGNNQDEAENKEAIG
jgi:hypothetical protein